MWTLSASACTSAWTRSRTRNSQPCGAVNVGGGKEESSIDVKMAQLKAGLKTQFKESDRLQAVVLKQLDLVDVEPSE